MVVTAMVMEHDAGTVLAVTVTPRAGKTGIVRIEADGARIQVAAPPVDGAANAALTRYLADLFDLPRSSVHLLAGASSRRKRVLLAGVSRAEVVARLSDLCSS